MSGSRRGVATVVAVAALVGLCASVAGAVSRGRDRVSARTLETRYIEGGGPVRLATRQRADGRVRVVVSGAIRPKRTQRILVVRVTRCRRIESGERRCAWKRRRHWSPPVSRARPRFRLATTFGVSPDCVRAALRDAGPTSHRLRGGIRRVSVPIPLDNGRRSLSVC